MTKNMVRRALSIGLVSIPFFTFAQTAVAAEDLRWSGDLRARSINLQEASDDSRLYQTFRARLGLRAKVQDDLDAVVRLATATSAISNNQTMGDSTSPGMVRRGFGIDHAYGEWKFLDEAKLVAGRAPTPFFTPGKTQLVFDVDLAFEGISLNYAPKFENGGAFATVGAFMISENYTTGNPGRDAVDTSLIAAEVGYILEAFGTWTAHVARYHYLNVADQPMTRLDSAASLDTKSTPFSRYRGNSIYSTNLMAFGFAQTEAGLEWKLKEDGYEFTTYFDWIANELAGDKGAGFEGGFIAKFGRLQALIAYASKKSDSVLGAYTDSDFNGGGTDNSGTKISLSYQLSDRTNVVLSDYRSARGMDSTRRDYSAQHLDFSLQF